MTTKTETPPGEKALLSLLTFQIFKDHMSRLKPDCVQYVFLLGMQCY